MGSDYPQATWLPSPNYRSTRKGYRVEGIIMHGTAGGDGASAAAWLANPQSGASVHFVVGQDGSVHQLVALTDSAWGNGIPQAPTWPVLAEHPGVNPNYYTVSIEHAKHSTDNSDALTAAQADASVALVSWLLTELPKRGLASANFKQRLAAGDVRTIVTSHSAIDSVDRARCPGTWDWTTYYSRLHAAPEDDMALSMAAKQAMVWGVRARYEGWPPNQQAVDAYAVQIRDDGSNWEQIATNIATDFGRAGVKTLADRVAALEAKVAAR